MENDEDYSDETEERPFTFPQVKPLYSTSRHSGRNSSQRKPLKPLRCLVTLEDFITEEEAQSGTLQKTETLKDDSPSVNSLSGKILPYCKKETDGNSTKDMSATIINDQFPLSKNDREKLVAITPVPLRLRTPFSSKCSMTLVKRIQKNFKPDCRTTDENGVHIFKHGRQVQHPLDLLSENCGRNREKQGGLVCSGNNVNKGERVFKDILNYNNHHANQHNPTKKSLGAAKFTPDSNGIYETKRIFIKPSVTYEKFSIDEELRKSPKVVNKMPSNIEKYGDVNSYELVENPEVPEKLKLQRSLFKTKEREENREVKNSDARVSNGVDPTILCVNNVQYSVLSKLGHGGSSEVYQVLDYKTSSLLAVKCVNLVDADSATAMGYLKEVEMLSKLQGSSRVIKLIDHEYLKHQQILYVVMEKGDIDLSTLLRQLSKTGEISLPMIIFYWTEMLHAVKEIHTHGIVHADLKPANFLLVCGRLKLIDFGIASAMQNDATSVLKNSMHGTCNYMSPEAIEDPGDSSRTKVGYKSDVWSLGCILYNLLYRRTPFQHITNNLKKLHAIANPNHKIEFCSVNKCPPQLMEAMKHCLTYDYKKRPSVAELLAVDYICSVNT